MQPVKRVEIVCDAVGLPLLLEKLESAGATGYTVLRGAGGKGERGTRAGDEPSGVFENVCVMTACGAGELAPLIEAVRPVLKRFGGVCLVSDAWWVIH